MSCSSVDDLEDQRRELVARRAMLEERFKLRLATAQEFGVIHTHRLGRVREAFAVQCGAARRRNQSILDNIHQASGIPESFLEEKAVSGLSRKRLSHQTRRFLAVADTLYPAWQEQRLHQKARQLGAIADERVVIQQRRRAATDRFEQEQALAVVVGERQRELVAAKAQERNELVLRQVQRHRSTADNDHALQAALERASRVVRAARHDAFEEVPTRRSNNQSSSGERRYIASGDDTDGRDESGVPGGEEVDQVWYDANSSRRATIADGKEGVGGTERGGDPSSRGDEQRTEGDGDDGAREAIGPQEWSSHAQTSGAGTGGVAEERGLPGMFCATGAKLSTATRRGRGDNAGTPARRSEEAAAIHEGRERAEAAGSKLRSPPPAAEVGDSSDGAPIVTAGSGGWEDARGQAIMAQAGYPQEPRDGEHHKQHASGLPLPRRREGAASPPRRRRSSTSRSFSSSDGIGDVMLSSGPVPGSAPPVAKAEDSRGVAPGAVGVRGMRAARLSSAGGRVCREDGGMGEGGERVSSAKENQRTAATSIAGSMSHDEESRGRVSLSAAARAVATLTAQVERLAASESGAAAGAVVGRNAAFSPSSKAPPLSLILDAYGSAALARSDAEGSFEMPALCGAVLDLVTAHATAILPAEALSGIVTAAKVRAQHRRGGNALPGRIQLFDAVTSHARRLHAAATASGGGADGGGADAAAIAAVFAPCFEPVFAARVAGKDEQNGVESVTGNARLRRKVVALLRSAADPNGEAVTGTMTKR
ncbi:unnamed protein product, partial [Scytosiphon promiscuus]